VCYRCAGVDVCLFSVIANISLVKLKKNIYSVTRIDFNHNMESL
jgi:hypothetical protein